MNNMDHMDMDMIYDIVKKNIHDGNMDEWYGYFHDMDNMEINDKWWKYDRNNMDIFIQ